MIQTLDVISVNIWQILISLINLLLLLLLLKKFLYKPVKKMLAARQQELDDRYAAAADAERAAQDSRLRYEEQLSGARAEADAILQKATETAEARADRMIEEAQNRADSMIRVAQNEAQLERQKANEDIKRQIVEVSGALAEKMLEREINTEDHKALIDSFLDQIGENDDRDQ